MRFVVKVGKDIVGFSELESGDPPMGVASGRFFPTAAYESIRQHCMIDAWQPIPTLTVEFKEGQPLERSGPVEIIDGGPKDGEELIPGIRKRYPIPVVRRTVSAASRALP